MSQSARHFAQKLNHCLDSMEAPPSTRERAVILSKLLNIPKQQARSLLEGHQIPDSLLLEKMAVEFDMDPQWFSREK